MKEETKVTFIVCSFVLLRELRPVEPFFTSFLTSPPLNFTTKEVNEQVYPFGTYFSLSLAVVIFLITDYFRYKPIIILDGITGILTYALLFEKPTLHILVIEQFFFGFFFSSDVACNTYLYAKIEDTSRYQKITGYVRASSLVGRFFSGVIAQVSVSWNILSKKDLVYFSAAGMVCATLLAFFIPSVGHSIYFHRLEKIPLKRKTNVGNTNASTLSEQKSTSDADVMAVVRSEKLPVVLKRLWMDFKFAYTNLYVVKWSLWWIIALCGFYFVNTYSQVLWESLVDRSGNGLGLMNGGVDCVYTILSAGAACLTGRITVSWKGKLEPFLALSSLILSLLVTYCYWSESLILIYASYIIYGTIFQTVLTVAQSEVARHLERDSYALIFGFNSFAALVIAGILTYTVIEGNVFYFTTRQQFLFYGGYYFALSMAFFAVSLIYQIRNFLSIGTVRSYCVTLK